ncbi:salivary peroxidase/catechol oxidase-like [Anticarsia gemmatalis]|uniref:salivary peroxidase/catechol oxidase-like n=1 Tax=Anticarsia gemmatalis TaxID=129554 RepID=UPI003F7775D1
MLLLLIFCLYVGSLNAVIYDCFSGKPATKSQIKLYIERNNTQYCLIAVKPCDPYEGRRIDGSCNNLHYPSIGMIRTPTIRILSPYFSANYEPKPAKDGSPLPPVRYLRTQILSEGRANDLHTTQLLSYYTLFAQNDVNTIHDIVNYVVNTTYCCTPRGKTNYICAPNKIPVDDPVHRYSGVSCQNLTKPQTFQYFGCADFGTTPWTRITFATSVFDLSAVYGNALGVIDKLRTYRKGLLKVEIDNGKIFPPGNPSQDVLSTLCMNEPPREKRCHLYQPNGVLGSNLITIIYYRQHNYIAKILAEMNPCWNDEKIFRTAADINVAMAMQIYFYELLPVLLGRRNLIRENVISWSGGFRDLYKGLKPQVFDEFTYANRWFHTIQDDELKLYDKHGYYLRSEPIVNFTTRTGYLPLDNNIDEIFQGSFRQLGGRFDQTVDYDMAERILGGLQYAFDGPMADLAKGRLMGMQPYVKYREFCARKPYRTFESLRDVMSEERIFRMSEEYKSVEDIDLMAAMWAENLVPGGRVPYTVYCLMVTQLKRVLASDRHWYERPNRPNAFTMRQLQAIRKVKIAGSLCNLAESVTKIQPNAFYAISPYNPLTDCHSPEIGKIDLSPWKDYTCDVQPCGW